jgi:hypothetical protein
MQFSPISRHFVSLRTEYSPQHPVLKHPQSMSITIYSEINLSFPQSLRIRFQIVYLKTVYSNFPYRFRVFLIFLFTEALLQGVSQRVGIAMKLLTLIRGCSVRISAGAPGIIPDNFRGFLQFLHEKSGIVPQLGRDRLFQILYNSSSSSHHLKQCSTANDSVIKQPHEKYRTLRKNIHIVMNTTIARQRLAKHVPELYAVNKNRRPY